MQTLGTVEKIKGNIAWIKTSRPESCQNCPSSGLCHTKELTMTVKNHPDAKVGDRVIIEAEDDTKAVFLISCIFLIPLAIFFIGYFLYTINPYLTLISILLAAGYFVLMKILNNKYKSPCRIIKILGADEKASICSREERD